MRDYFNVGEEEYDARQALCAKSPDARDVHFATNPDYVAEAVEMCNRCPIRIECLNAALEVEYGTPSENRFGIYGGYTPRERAEMDGAE